MIAANVAISPSSPLLVRRGVRGETSHRGVIASRVHNDSRNVVAVVIVVVVVVRADARSVARRIKEFSDLLRSLRRDLAEKGELSNSRGGRQN